MSYAMIDEQKRYLVNYGKDTRNFHQLKGNIYFKMYTVLVRLRICWLYLLHLVVKFQFSTLRKSGIPLYCHITPRCTLTQSDSPIYDSNRFLKIICIRKEYLRPDNCKLFVWMDTWRYNCLQRIITIIINC